MGPDSPVIASTSLGPSGALQSSPSSTGSSAVWPQTTLLPLTYSPSEKSRESGSQRHNPIPGQGPLRTLTRSSGEDLGLYLQFSHQLLQPSLQECPKWEEPLSPRLKMLLQASLKFQHPKNPQEILLDMRDPQSDVKRLFQVML